MNRSLVSHLLAPIFILFAVPASLSASENWKPVLSLDDSVTNLCDATFVSRIEDKGHYATETQYSYPTYDPWRVPRLQKFQSQAWVEDIQPREPAAIQTEICNRLKACVKKYSMNPLTTASDWEFLELIKRESSCDVNIPKNDQTAIDEAPSLGTAYSHLVVNTKEINLPGRFVMPKGAVGIPIKNSIWADLAMVKGTSKKILVNFYEYPELQFLMRASDLLLVDRVHIRLILKRDVQLKDRELRQGAVAKLIGIYPQDSKYELMLEDEHANRRFLPSQLFALETDL